MVGKLGGLGSCGENRLPRADGELTEVSALDLVQVSLAPKLS